MTVKNRLRPIREKAGVTQKELAERSGLPHGTLARIDGNPTSKLSLYQARQIAKALGIDPFSLLPR
ncbi:MAG TPA: helix-turn-helix transcriptional regulator [Candidatus Baltobacteraceae bacterium]|jgi:transcriptional regulator with XRE-family HTH domain|nr:helix-turn-helix transcriptional regulator [Candidatus Baltobacteraceae bacterium]